MITLITAVFAIALISAIWHVVFNVYPHSAIALARYNLFELRDELFALGAEGKLDFKSPGYKACRQMINGFIRYAHDMSLMQMLTTQLVAKVRKQKVSTKEWDAAFDRLDPEARKLVDGVMRQAMVHMVRLLITKSVILSSIFALAICSEFVFKWICKAWSVAASSLRRGDEQNIGVRASDIVIREMMANPGSDKLKAVMKTEAKRYTSPGFGMALSAAA
ncbi:hypothetical protein [Xanthomonas sp. D-109]|uniref:hypothetical protein n=1 Tax=Xanthomonas sp. D-109 TaxID=2821274 RepID=UPI001ADB666A|nr:hypothetical protein [Xanthomonas sp. D-109]MBO9883717.1 hypothetical protein [Xanthomonas sp. D-109]